MEGRNNLCHKFFSLFLVIEYKIRPISEFYSGKFYTTRIFCNAVQPFSGNILKGFICLTMISKTYISFKPG